MKEQTNWIGKWEVIITDLKGNVIEKTGLRPNLIMDNGLNVIRDALGGFITDTKIKYIALGNSNIPPANNQTQLGSEQFRKQITTHTAMPSIGSLETVSYISENEANDFVTEEIGWFAGADATDEANSGIMVARVLYGRKKNNLEIWTIRRVDNLWRG